MKRDVILYDVSFFCTFFINKICKFADGIIKLFTMKKLLLSIITSVILSGSVFAQNVARECVLFEVFTGVNCPYCPAAAISIGRMLDEGKSIAAVAYHTSAFSVPEFFTSETNARASYYYISAYPTVKVDGRLSPSVGGQSSDQTSIDYSYNQCVSSYNQRINVSSPYTIELSFDYVAGTECKVTAAVNKVGDCNGSDVRLFVVMTESHIQRNWQGMTEVNFVTRDMIPNQNGTPLTSDSQTFEATIDMAGFSKNNCEIVAWVQSYTGNKEVFQAVKLPLSELVMQYDLNINNVEEVLLGSCSGKMAPRLTLENNGTESLSSIVFDVKDENGTVLATSQWEGSLAANEETEYVMPEFDFDDAENIVIEAVEINGNSDGYPVDNIRNIQVAEPIIIEDSYIKLQLKTGDDPENMSIEFKNMDDGEIVNTFTYDDDNKIYTEEFNLPKEGCYRMTIRNTVGNGFGGGFWGIRDSKGTTLISGSNHDNPFRYELALEISCLGVNVVEIDNNSVDVYPNPATSMINVVADNMKNVSVYNAVGQMIYTEDGASNNVMIDSQSWTSGFYYVTVETSDGSRVSQKIVVNK